MKLAERLNHLGTETAIEALGVLAKLKAEGKDIISFGVGEPDFDTPANIKHAAIEAIKNNDTHYVPSQGILPLREAIAADFKRVRGVTVSPDQIIAMPGAKIIVCYTMMSLINPGDEVIYPNPGYPIYESMCDFAGGKGVPLPMLEEKEFSFNFEDLKNRVTDKTKLIVLNSPQNPTGGVIPKEDLEKVAALAKEKDIWVLSDEIYARITFGQKHHSILSIPGMEERTIVLDGHSKIFAMTGWRLGYCYVPKTLVSQFVKLIVNYNACATSFVQTAGVEALNGPQDAENKMVAEFSARCDLIHKELNSIPGITCVKPKGAFYIFPNVTEVIKKHGFRDTVQLQEYLLQKGNVMVLARTYFGHKNPEEKEEYIRLSYATSQDMIKKGMERIRKALADTEGIKDFLKEQK